MKFKSYCKRGESRKGQITLFILMGIVLLLIVGLGVYLKGIVSEQDDLEVLYISDLDSYIETCIENSLESQVPLISKNGGVLREDFLYKGDSYNLICYEEEGRGCINTFLTKEDMQKELSLNLLPLVDKCIDLSIFEQQGFLIKKGTLKVDVFIGFDDVRLNLEYPLTLERLGQIIKKNTFSAKISSPLGRLHSLAQHILNQEILFDNFDKDQWAKKYGSSIRIEKMKPYPATLYKLTTVNRHGKKYAYHFGKLGKASVLELVPLPS